MSEDVIDKDSKNEFTGEDFHKQLLDAVDHAVIATDLDWNIIYWNRYAEDLYGWKAGEVVGRSVMEIVPNDASREQAEKIMHQLHAGESWHGEFNVVRKDKTTFLANVHDSPIFNAKREVIGMVGVSYDISGRKAVEDDLHLKDKAMAAFLNGIAFGDLEGNLSYINKTYLKMWGYEDENELLGRNAAEFWKEPGRATAIIKEVVEKGSVIGQLTAKRKDGSFFEVQLMTARLDDDNGNPIALTGSFIDISQLTEAKQLLTERNKKLDCLYWLGELIEEPGITLPEILQGTVDLIPEAWQFPEAACARIVLEGEDGMAVSDPFEETGVRLASDIWSDGEKAGTVELFYMDTRPLGGKDPFMDEEHKLIEAVSGRLGRMLERFRAKDALSEREERYRSLFEESNDAIFIHDLEGKIFEVNKKACDMLEFDRETILALPILDLHPEDERGEGKKALVNVRESGATRFETRYRKSDGSDIHVDVSARVIDREKELVQAIVRDITERKQQESEWELTISLLKLINSISRQRDLMKMMTKLIQEWSGCHAVGIRLQDGDDFPYYETRGFPQIFVKAENSLCELDKNGKVVRDEEGSPVLACMCGNVIKGRFDPSKPFFSENGSFWTNSTTDLLSATNESDRQARTRNRCNGEGYESVALIPLRTPRHTFGLLQINDFRKDRFTERRIALYESLANSIAAVLSERKAYETVRDSEKKFRILVETQNDLVVKFDRNWHLTFVNPRYCEVFGRTEKELLGRTFVPLIHEADRRVVEKSLEKLQRPPYKTYHEERVMTVEGWRWFGWSAHAVIGEDGNIGEFISVGRDIDDRKNTEEELNNKIDQLNRSNQLMVGRELEMIRLKREVNALLEELGRPKNYSIPDEIDRQKTNR